MAMTLRLTDAESEALRRQAAAEGRSMGDVARAAVREYVARRDRRAALAESMAWALEEYARTFADLADR